MGNQPHPTLSDSLRERLWTLAQHKYGWGYANGWRDRRAYDALVRRGLTHVVESRTHGDQYAYALTDDGILEVHRRWPVSPAILGTYEHQAGGWTPVEGVLACP